MKRVFPFVVLSLFASVAIAGVVRPGSVGTVAPPAKGDKKAVEAKKETVKDTAKPQDAVAGKHKADDKAKLKAPEKHAEPKGTVPGK